MFANHFEPYFGSIRLNDITPQMVEMYLLTRKRSGAANGTLWRELRLFKCLMRIADSREWVYMGKFRHITLPREKGRESVATMAALDAIRILGHEDLWDIVFDTG
ncbi:MAG: hypothetical protein KC588_02900, partial [Nitrospira sp.]|nr:hypothetical protein [Nitrospira sp.]